MLKRRSERRQVARDADETLQFVAFRVGAELYGLDIGVVREIERMQPITKVPQALAFVEGVINIRGAIIPVVDLARRFGLPATVPDRQTRIVIASLRGRDVGFIVGAVTEVLPIAARAIGPPPPLTFERMGRFVAGMARLRDELIAILDLGRLLSAEEIDQLEQQQSLF